MYSLIIADDEFLFREEVKIIILNTGLPLQILGEAEDGQHAFDMILKLSPDIVVIDIHMPILSGIDLLEKTRQAGLNTQFIIISGYSEFVYAKKAVTMGAVEYILKPINNEELELALKKACANIDKEAKQFRFQHFFDDSETVYYDENLLNSKVLSPDPNQLIADIVKYIKTHFHEDINLEMIAHQKFVSYKYLSRLFKSTNGMVFSDYITLLRMNRASELLITTQLLIKEIASNTGYTDHQYFHRVFKKHNQRVYRILQCEFG